MGKVSGKSSIILALFFFANATIASSEPLRPQQDPETQKILDMGYEYAASALDSYTYGLASQAYKTIIPKKNQGNDGSDLSAKALKQIKSIVEAAVSSAIIDQTNTQRLTDINQQLQAVYQQMNLVQDRIAAGEAELTVNQTAMEDLRTESARLVNLAGFQIENANYPQSAKTPGQLYVNTNFLFVPQYYLAASLRLKILALSEAFGGLGYRQAIQREAQQYIRTLQQFYVQFYDWNNERFEYASFKHLENDNYAYPMGGVLQDKNASAYVWREMTLYRHRDQDFDNLKFKLFDSGMQIAKSWAALAGISNFQLTDRRDPAALYPQAIYQSSARYSGNGQPLGPYTYTFVFSTRNNPGRPDHYCSVDEATASSQSATPIVGIRYSSLATYNSKKAYCGPRVIEALRQGRSLSSEAELDPETVWQQLPGIASDIGVYNQSISAVLGFGSADNTIFKWNQSDWIHVPGYASKIDVGSDGSLWVVNSAGSIYRNNGNGFVELPGLASDIGVGANGSAWVISRDGGNIYRWNGSNWDQIPGWGKRISVGPDGNALVVNPDGKIYRYTGSAFVEMPGRATDVGVGADGSLWIIGDDPNPYGFGIYKWAGSNWQKVEGGGIAIDVDSTGQPWIVNNSGSIYRAIRN